MKKIGINIMQCAEMDEVEQIKLFKKVGFDAFFSCYGRENTAALRKTADEIGIIYQSIHAPFYRMNHMWELSPETESTKQELLDCVEECSIYNVPIMVTHPYIGFDKNTPTELGIENFKEVVDFAKEKGIKVAFENVEGEAYLQALMDEFCDYDNVGFCWDSGHEMCYNRHKDMLKIYGDRLFATHINDNLGVSGEEITFHDDLHLIPFDGIKDWQDAMERLLDSKKIDVFTLELKFTKGVDHKAGTDYCSMQYEDYLNKVYQTAQKLLNKK